MIAGKAFSGPNDYFEIKSGRSDSCDFLRVTPSARPQNVPPAFLGLLKIKP
jgi:hypothetical protein